MRNLLADIRCALRQLRKSLGFTVFAILIMAFGIGATTAVFSIVEGILLRPLPFPHSDRLMSLSDTFPSVDVGGNGEVGVTEPDVAAYTLDTRTFENLGAYGPITSELSGVGEAVQVNAAVLSSGVFPALGVPPLLGRFFTRQEDDSKEQVAVVSYLFWRSRMHGDLNVLGTKILLDRKPYVVIGVMPRNFEFPLAPGHLNNSQLWIPMSLNASELSAGAASSWNYMMVGRLKPGATPIQAQREAARIVHETMQKNVTTSSGLPSVSASVRPLQEQTVEQARPLLRILFLAIIVVLLIACANLAGLLLVRAIRRRREFAVRLALGAQARVLLLQAILECLILTVSGGVLGLLLADGAIRAGVSRLPETLPRIAEIGLDWRVVLFGIRLAIVTGVLCGLAPAFAALRTSVNETLKEGGRSGTSGHGHARLRSALVIGEIAIALVLLVASGLLLRSYDKMRAVSLGFHPENVLTASYSLPQKQYATQEVVDEFNHEMLRRLQQLPAVKAVGLTSVLPATGNHGKTSIVAEGYIPPKGLPMNFALITPIQGDYLQAMGIPLLAGRLLAPSDTAEMPLVAIVNRRLAQHCWPNADPIGRRFRVGTEPMKTPWITIVGEVADVTDDSPDSPNAAQYYAPTVQYEKSLGALGSPSDGPNGAGGYIALSTMLPPLQLAGTLRAAVHAIDPQLPLTQIQSMERIVSDSEGPRRFNTAILSAFATASVLLAFVGIYGVIAFSVALREQETAIRTALGSPRSGIVSLVFKSASRLAITGCVLGLLGAAAASQLLRSFLFDVSPFDPFVLAGAALFVLLLALTASLLPARRAAKVDPMVALRYE